LSERRCHSIRPPNTSLELTIGAGGSRQDALDAESSGLAAQLSAVRQPKHAQVEVFAKGYVDIIVEDSQGPWDPIEVRDLTYSQVTPRLLQAVPRSPIATEDEFVALVRATFMPLAARVLWRRLVALRFHLDRAERSDGSSVRIGRGDIRLTDNRTMIGLKPSAGPTSDLFVARDELISADLAASESAKARFLLANPTVRYCIENFIQAITSPDYMLAHIYKAVEAIQADLGGRAHFTTIGLAKAYIDYVMQRANRSAADERHAPRDPAALDVVPISEKRECLIRVRETISRYAAHLILPAA
jgi:hypothetical protein